MLLHQRLLSLFLMAASGLKPLRSMWLSWALIAGCWLLPIGSMWACPYDLHGFSSCSAVSQAARTTSFYLMLPGIWLGSSLSSLVSDPRSGMSFAALIAGCLLWLLLLSLGIWWLASRLRRRALQPPSIQA